ncbi:hypothetical protein SDC9_64668 [bioreactor metagenome]|uniref:Uncharacterized protein n=1 Tax=bioreactor metagenome TaxID=1076179 RepID=A0A644XPX9_9ZZZZ
MNGSVLAEDGVVDLPEVDVHGLLVGVEIDRAVAPLVAKAGRLHPTEGRPQVTNVVRVEPDHACLDVLREVVGALEVVGPHVRGETVAGVVGEAEGLLVGVERGDRHHGAEDLLLEDPGARLDVGEDRRSDEVAELEALGPAATGHQAALAPADLDVAHHLGEVLRVDQGADLGLRVVRVADPDPLGLGGVALDELVVHRALDQDPAASGASLAIKREHTEDRRVDGSIEVRIGEHDGRGLATELHRQTLEVRRGIAEDDLPGTGLAGERDQRDLGMLHEGVTRVLAQAVDEVEDPPGQPRLLEDPRPERCGQRGELGRLQDDGVARGEGGGELPALQHERRVPRRDQARHADRLAVDVVHLPSGHLVGVVTLRHDQVREEAEVLRRSAGLPEGLGDGQTRVERLELRQTLVAGLDEVGDAVQDARPLAGQHLRPRAVHEGPAGRLDRPIDVGLLAGCGLHVGLVRHGLDHVERIPVHGIDELTVDVVLDTCGQIRRNMALVECGRGHGTSSLRVFSSMGFVGW